MTYLLLATAAFFIQTLANKEMGRRFDPAPTGLYYYNAIGMTLTALLLIPLGGIFLHNIHTLITATLFAISFALTMSLLVMTMREGPLFLTSLFIGMSIVVPVTAGLLVFGETLTLLKVLGLCCVLAVIVLTSLPSRKVQEKQITSGWLKKAFLLMFVNGSLGVIQKWQTNWIGSVDNASFSFYSFLICASIFWVLLALSKRKPGVSLQPWNKPSLYLCSVALAVGTSTGNLLLLMALAALPAIVVYPANIGALVAVTWLASLFIYKEPFTSRGLAAMLTGLAGIVLLAL